MRYGLRILAVLIGLVAAAAVAVWWIVWPPAPLPLPERGALLDGVTLIEPGVARRPDMRLVIEGEQIASVGPAAGAASTGPYAGMFVLPGLVDLHVHHPPPSLPGQSELFALLELAHGVTSVRDAGDTDGQSTAPARDGVANDAFPGPRVFACGPFVDGDPPQWRNSLAARTPDEGRAAVRKVADGGFDCVKAYNGLDAPTLAAIRDEAVLRDLPVIGHVPRQIPLEEALLDDGQHLIGVPERLSDPALMFPRSMVGWLSLDDARLDTVISVSLANGLAQTPTLVTIDRLIAQEDREAALREPDAQLLPAFYRELIWSPEVGISSARGVDAETFAMLREAHAVQLRTVKRLFDAGVELHTGTDSLIAFVVPGAALHRELRLFVRAGLTPEQALAVSTHASSRALRVEGLGELRAGAPADLVVFREDPTVDLAALDSIAAVVRDGRLYTRASLDERIARRRAHHDGAAYRALLEPLVRRALAGVRAR
jgi:imidazolonepropionase-like amidohydrolase